MNRIESPEVLGTCWVGNETVSYQIKDEVGKTPPQEKNGGCGLNTRN